MRLNAFSDFICTDEEGKLLWKSAEFHQEKKFDYDQDFMEKTNKKVCYLKEIQVYLQNSEIQAEFEQHEPGKKRKVFSSN